MNGGWLCEMVDFIDCFPPFCDGTYFTPPEITAFLIEAGEIGR